jgi:hypothetical protein
MIVNVLDRTEKFSWIYRAVINPNMLREVQKLPWGEAANGRFSPSSGR